MVAVKSDFYTILHMVSHFSNLHGSMFNFAFGRSSTVFFLTLLLSLAKMPSDSGLLFLFQFSSVRCLQFYYRIEFSVFFMQIYVAKYVFAIDMLYFFYLLKALSAKWIIFADALRK